MPGILPQGAPAPRRRTHRGRNNVAAYSMLAPSLFGLVAFLVLPILVVFWLSFQSWDLLSPITPAGLANYGDVFSDPTFYNSLAVTLFFVVIVIPVQTVLGVAAALLLTRGLRGSLVFRTIYILPWVCAPLALGIVWRWILAPTDGLLNDLIGTRIEWLSDPALALPSVAAVVIWSNVGYITLFFMAGLLNIPTQILDAARMDGAGPVATFFRIKLPLLRPTTFFVLVTSVISVFQLFDQIYALTGGGPFVVTDAGTYGRTDVVASRIYSEAFSTFDLGHAAVMAVVLLVVLVAITLGQQLYFGKRTTYDLS
ncbi:carbohydrate ABC transporter permease [Mycetocola zhujimingii]|uniref:Sugar ABC transporter permease n=1 Tax=Mycetocola zhujimingii TaxID=2079792 RepID=A0A2U1TBR7_9MICO|nr:sugar ABC transporter permease [Mycetocola zhujimingii]AWB87549.1 sugar ABC transporter permease [Mycetocola zhujimingii]PWC06331.1 sugar ABC transporter permease [Mycetocola zhujimingii]